MNYEKLLAYQPMLNPNIRLLVEQLQNAEVTKEQLHSRKAYAKRKGNLLSVIEYSVAQDILNMLENYREIS